MEPSHPNSTHGLLVDIEQHPQGSVYRLTVARPQRLNILDSAAMLEINGALARIAEDDTARAVILAGSGGKAWIGGADINEMVSLNSETAKAFITRLHTVCLALRELPVPVVASIDGFCLGAGLEIAACCDLRIATPISRFGMPEVLVGIPSVTAFSLMDNLNPRIQTAQLEGSGARLASHCLLDESIKSAISYKHQWIILLRYLDFPGGEVTQVSA